MSRMHGDPALLWHLRAHRSHSWPRHGTPGPHHAEPHSQQTCTATQVSHVEIKGCTSPGQGVSPCSLEPPHSFWSIAG